MKKILKTSYFTLLELLVSMAVFAVLIVALSVFYNSALKSTSETNSKTMIFENARIALDLMTRDIQTIYYESNPFTIPFWHWKPASPPSSWGENRNEFLAFVSSSNISPVVQNSTLCEVKYQKYYSSNHDDENDGWLRRSILSDDAGSKWNYNNNFIVGYSTDTDTIPGTDSPVAAFTATSVSSGEYQRVIPYVTDLKFTCYDKEGNILLPDNKTFTTNDAGSVTEFPFSIKIDLTLMDKNSWKKWIQIDTSNDPNANIFRQNHIKTFTKTVLIGDRGQYD